MVSVIVVSLIPPRKDAVDRLDQFNINGMDNTHCVGFNFGAPFESSCMLVGSETTPPPHSKKYLIMSTWRGDDNRKLELNVCIPVCISLGSETWSSHFMEQGASQRREEHFPSSLPSLSFAFSIVLQIVARMKCHASRS